MTASHLTADRRLNHAPPAPARAGRRSAAGLVLGSLVALSAPSGAPGSEPRPVDGLGPGSAPSSFVPLGDRLLFRTEKPRAVWAADIQGAVERLVGIPDDQRIWGGFAVLGDRALFGLRGADGDHLWRTDGTAAGTAEIAALGGRSFVSQAARVIDRLVLAVGYDERVLWVTDGSPQGTRPLVSTPLPLFGFPVALGAAAVFLEAGAPSRVWRTDGTPEGTAPFAEVHLDLGAREEVAVVGGRVFFPLSGDPSGSVLGASDGTAAGTGPIAGPAGSSYQEMVVVDDRLFALSATLLTETRLREDLWIIQPGANRARHLLSASGIGQLTALAAGPEAAGSRLLMIVIPDDRHGPALWVSDGSASGTRPVVEVGPVLQLSLRESLSVPGLLFFTVLEPNGFEESRQALWRTDGTPQGTFRLALLDQRDDRFDFGERMATVGSRLLFTVRERDGVRLRVTDGRLAGTRDLAFFAGGVSRALPLITFPPYLYIAADAADVGRTLWSLPIHEVFSAADLCLGGETGCRFAVDARWRSGPGAGGPAFAVDPASDRSANLWFFSPENWEVLVKVIDGCDHNGWFWVFAAAATDLTVELEVTDTLSLAAWRRTLGDAASTVADTGAFRCP